MNLETSGIATRVRSYFPAVNKLPLLGPDNVRTQHYGLFRDDDGICFGPSVSRLYEPHTTEDIVAICEASEHVFGEIADVNLGFDDGHYVSVQPTKDRRIEAHKGDTVWPRLIIEARYGQAFRASVGMYRDVCRNLAMPRQVEGTRVSIRHTSGLRAKMDDLIADLNMIKGGWDSLAAHIHAMATRRVRLAEFLDAMYPAPPENSTARSLGRHRSRTEAIINRIMRERTALGNADTNLHEVSAWEAFNGLQGYIQHDKSRRGNPGTFQRAILAMDDSVVAKAESLLMTLGV
jgi:hypothetical protein